MFEIALQLHCRYFGNRKIQQILANIQLLTASLCENPAENSQIFCKIAQTVTFGNCEVDAWCLGWSCFYLLTAQSLFSTADPKAEPGAASDTAREKGES